MNLGLRYDYSVASYPSFPFLDQFSRPTGQLSEANDHVYDYSVVSPRVGVNYRLLSQTIVKGHYGRYYSAIERDYAAIVPSTSIASCLVIRPPETRPVPRAALRH